MNPKTLIIGHGRHGKDTVAELFNQHFGLTYMSSSEMALDLFIYNKLKSKYGYSTKQECYGDRVNHRVEWYDLICEYNTPDNTRLAKELLLRYGCYVGMRDFNEFMGSYESNLFDLIIWVDASGRLPEEHNSFNIEKSYADFIIENNGTRKDLEKKIIRIGKQIFKI